jgi:hypothetical protein
MASAHDKYARDYDNQIKNHDCHIAEILFGLSLEREYPPSCSIWPV